MDLLSEIDEMMDELRDNNVDLRRIPRVEESSSPEKINQVHRILKLKTYNLEMQQHCKHMALMLALFMMHFAEKYNH
jgi:hypothetical protein